MKYPFWYTFLKLISTGFANREKLHILCSIISKSWSDDVMGSAKSPPASHHTSGRKPPPRIRAKVKHLVWDAFFFPLSVKVSDDLFSLLNVFNCVPFRYHNRFILVSGKINICMCQSAIQWVVFCEMFRIFTQLNRDLWKSYSVQSCCFYLSSLSQG